MEILLGQEEVNLSRPDNDGRTLLSHAAMQGNEGVVRMPSGGKRITLTSQMRVAEHRSRMPLLKDTREL